MKEARYFYVPNAAALNELPAEEAVHALRVLRLKEGDEMFLMDGEGNFYQAEVVLATAKKCVYTIRQTMRQKPAWSGRIHLAIAPTKDMGRMEWMAEKATEVGFDEISFLDCRFSERKTLRADRIEKIVVSAVKQSRKGWKPLVNPMSSFSSFVENCPDKGRKFICHCYPEIPRTDFFTAITSALQPGIFLQNGSEAQKEHPSGAADITVLIGPEGDFSIEEVRLAMAHGFESVTLGKSRLRTETAGLSAVMMSQLARRV